MKSERFTTTPYGNILIIDDEIVVCNGCRMALTEYGYISTSVNSGKEGIAEVLKDNYDLILLDMKLPDMDGMEVLNQIRLEKPDINIIVMTGYASVQNAVEAMKKGAFDYLSKPFSDDELILSVGKALENRRLIEENIALRKQLFAKFDFSNIVGDTPQIKAIFEKIQRAAPTDTTILLEGESGTGKELFAKAIHTHSKRADRQFVVVDCNTFSPTLLESELFGHVKGAFTGATQDKAGLFDTANGGTLFLDEIGNLNHEAQGKLLRVIESQQYKPVGASHIKKVDIRIIAATNKDLNHMVKEDLFREDLFYRLCVLPIKIPPLRERKEDIPRLAYHFLRIFSKEMGRRIQGFSDEALEILKNYDWPGNVRQLKNVIERLVIMTDESILHHGQLIENLRSGEQVSYSKVPERLDELKAIKHKIIEDIFNPIERKFLLNALDKENWHISRAAKFVRMQRSNFSTLLKKHNITPQQKTDA